MSGPRRPRAGATLETRVMLAFGAILLLLIPAARAWLPPSSSVIGPDAATRVLGVFGGALLLLGLAKSSARLELDGPVLRYRRFLRTRSVDLREAPILLETTGRSWALYGGIPVAMEGYDLHVCRARGGGIPEWARRAGETGVLASRQDFAAAAAENGVEVVLTVVGYVWEKPDQSAFDPAGVARLLAEARRAVPELFVAPAVLRRLGPPAP